MTPAARLFGRVTQAALLADTSVRESFTSADDTIQSAALYSVIGLLAWLCFTCFAVWFMAKRISRPLRKLKKDMDQVGRLNFDQGWAEEHSHIRGNHSHVCCSHSKAEMQTINSVYSRMRNAVRSFGKFVPNTVVNRIINGDSQASQLYVAHREVVTRGASSAEC